MVSSRTRPAEPQPRRLRWSRSGSRVWFWIVLVLFVYVNRFRSTLIDDAYITMQYARTLSEHFTWGFYPDRLANTATSPLNVIVMAVVGLPFRSFVDVVVIVTAAELAVMLAVLLRISRRLTSSPHFGVVAFVGLAANPLLVSAIGLEGYLYATLMLVAVELFLGRRWALLAVCLGLLTLTRADGVLFGVLVVLLLPVPAKLKMIGLWAATLLPWGLFSWIVLGSLVPDTLFIKLGQRWGQMTFIGGPSMYLEQYPLATFGTVWLLAFAPLAVPLLRRASVEARRIAVALALYGVAHFAGYALLAVPPYHWYYTHQVVPIVFFGSLGVAHLLRTWTHSPSPAVQRAAYAPALLPAAVLVAVIAADIPLRQAPIHTNWAPPEEYRAIGLWLREHIDASDTIDLYGEIGTLAYTSQRQLIDPFSDPTQVERDDLPPPFKWVTDVNFAWREEREPFPPPSYVIEFYPDPHAGPQDPNVVRTWDVSSRWVPQMRVVLRRIGSTVET